MNSFFKTYITILLCGYFSTLFCMNPATLEYQPQPRTLMYAPWREKYDNTINNKQHTSKQHTEKSCIFCGIVNDKKDSKNYVLLRADYSLIMLANQPYIDNGIHFLLVPYKHIRELSNVSPETYSEENTLTQKLCALFSIDCNEIYINTNEGSSAGASIPTHHHKHIIVNKSPRYYNLIHAIKEKKNNIELSSLFNSIHPHIQALHNSIIPQQDHNNIYNKNCYHCSVIIKDTRENLIIHKGKHSTIMLSHYPTYFGEIDIIPNAHIESIATMPIETYTELNNLTIAIYPLLLKFLETQDSNIGLLSYGMNATHREHIKQKIIPRKIHWNTTPITGAHHINANIKKLYNKLLAEWQLMLSANNYVPQTSKL